MILQPIVEGQGDVAAVPVLLRRLAEVADAREVRVARPHRRPRTKLVRKDTLQESVRVARLTPGCSAILILFDADGSCPMEIAPALAAWAQEAADPIPCAVVMANREYEAWFLAAIESLRGTAGIRPDAAAYASPETPRDAKGALESMMRSGASYLATADQVRLTARLDLPAAYSASRSFRKLVEAFGALLRASGTRLLAWPPQEWRS